VSSESPASRVFFATAIGSARFARGGSAGCDALLVFLRTDSAPDAHHVAGILGLRENLLRVITPEVGGGFAPN